MQITNPVVLERVLSALFKDKYIAWLPETLEIELLKLKHPVLSRYGKDAIITNMIDAIRALKSDKSYALDEWHILEKVIAALTGKAVLFFDAQPPASFHEVFLAVEIIKKLLNTDSPNFSEETRLYLGLILLDLGVFSFPFEPYKSYIKLAVEHHVKTPDGEQLVKDFEAKMSGILKKPEFLGQLMEEIEKNPETDLLKNLNSVALFNAITSLCSYLFIKADLDQDIPASEALSDTSTPLANPEPELAQTPESENLSPEIIQEVFSLIETLNNGESVKIAARRIRAVSDMPRTGTYIINPDPDAFNNDHIYEAGGAIPAGTRGSLVENTADKDLGDFFQGGSTVSQGLDAKKVVDKFKTDDPIAKLFAELDF